MKPVVESMTDRQKRELAEEVYYYTFKKQTSTAILYKKILKRPFNYLLSDDYFEEVYKFILRIGHAVKDRNQSLLYSEMKQFADKHDLDDFCMRFF